MDHDRSITKILRKAIEFRQGWYGVEGEHVHMIRLVVSCRALTAEEMSVTGNVPCAHCLAWVARRMEH